MYLPKHKLDNYYIEELNRLSNDDFSKIYKELFKWLYNMNQPVAREVTSVLSKRHLVIKEELLKILKDREIDPVFKYNIIRYVVFNFNKEDRRYYKNISSKIKDNPSKKEKYAEVDNIATEVLNSL